MIGYLLTVAAAAAALIWLGRERKKRTAAIRQSMAIGTWGVLLMALGALVAVSPLGLPLKAAALAVAAAGAVLVAWYLRFSVRWDEEGFTRRELTREKTYRYDQILGQLLYVTTGGGVIIELHLDDGSALSLNSGMEGVYPFLDAAFAGWLAQKGLTLADCPWHDPQQSCWFPTVEG